MSVELDRWVEYVLDTLLPVELGSDVSVGGRCAYKTKAENDAVGGVYASEANADADVDVEAELCIAHRRVGVKARWHFDAIMICNINEY